MKRFLHKIFFIIRVKFSNRLLSNLNKIYYSMQGMYIGKNTNIPSIMVTWPHQVSIGNYCKLENNIQFKFDGIWKKGPNIIIGNNVFLGNNIEFNIRKSIHINNNCLIASGVKFIDHDHGFIKNKLMNAQQGIELDIIIGEDVWIGANAIILKGVEINSGAIVAAGSVVNTSIASNEIWGGIPAKKISERK